MRKKAALPERKYYLDNLRSAALLLLVVWHIVMGFAFLGVRAALIFHSLIDPWWRELMFVLAGISMNYSLRKRGLGEFIKERTNKLLVPLLFTLLLFVPVTQYFYFLLMQGSAHYLDFFTSLPAFVTGKGYGTFGFTQLWFLLFLYPMALLLAPVVAYVRQRVEKTASKSQTAAKKPTFASKIPWPLLYLFAIIPAAMPALSIEMENSTYYSFGKFFAYFLLGYFMFADDGVMEQLEKARFLSLGLFAAAMASIYLGPPMLRDALSLMIGWFAALAFLGLARRYFNSGHTLFRYLSKSSFAIYLFHNSYPGIALYFISKVTENFLLQFVLITLFTYAMSFLTYELFKRFRVTRWMFGLQR